MRTLQVDAARTFRGGEAQVLALARGLARAGHETLIVARPESALFERASREGLGVRGLSMRGGWDLVAAVRLTRSVREFRADLIHAHDAHGLSLSILASRLTGRPLVLSRRVDFPLSTRFRFRYRNAPARILAVSREVARVLGAAGVPPERISVVYDGVDPDAVAGLPPADEILARYGLRADGVYVGNVASLTDHKGQRYFIEAAPAVLERFPDAIFLIAGEGELRKALEELIRARGLKGKVLLLGFVPDVHRLYRALRVFVMSSHLEGLGSAVLEAMSAKVPVVASASGGLPELVENERTGLLVRPKDPEALAGAIVRLLEDRVLSTRLAEEGERRVRASFTVEKMVERTLEAYHEVAGK